jgi:hypothetical protein
MKHLVRALFVLLTVAVNAWAAPATMRVDYYHTGNDTEERFSLDRVVVEPLPWPGNMARTIDTTNRGKYFFEVRDAESGRTLYSRGFGSIYGEWETTAEAKEMNRTFSESLRFPAVDQKAVVSLQKRDARNEFQEIWSFGIDPSNKFIEKGVRRDAGPLLRIHEAGDPAQKLDLLILGDGYTLAERSKFERDARRMTQVLFETAPFSDRQGDINVWGLSPAAAESGISRPSQGIFRRSPVGTSYDTFDSERYILTLENRTFRELAANAPYDVVEILTNTETYGGGGIFNLFSTAAANNLWAPYLFIHEFGHHVAGLADEYYTSDVAYLPAPEERIEPWEPNVTALHDPATLKWKDLVAPGTPLPTPWPKPEFEEYTRVAQERRRRIRAENAPESAMNDLFHEEMAHDTELLNSGPLAGTVGAFEGANYETRGYFRPQADSIMFTRDDVPFCQVCQRAIVTILDLYTRP